MRLACRRRARGTRRHRRGCRRGAAAAGAAGGAPAAGAARGAGRCGCGGRRGRRRDGAGAAARRRPHGAGAGAMTGAAAGAAACARACAGGSNSSVYSRTRRPVAQLTSRITSTKGSSTARSLVTRSYGRPSARRCQLHLRARQHGVVVDAGGAVGLGRRHAQLQRDGFLGRQAGDVDLGPQRLAQRRLHGQPPQAQRPGLRAPQAGGGQRPPRSARSAPRSSSGVSRRLPNAIERGAASEPAAASCRPSPARHRPNR